MDITFDLAAASPPFRAPLGRHADVDRNIQCTDETPRINDRKNWVRCRFIAEEIDYATRYLEQLGLKTGPTYRNIRITPINGGYGFHIAAAFAAAVLIALLMLKDRWSLRADIQHIRDLGWRVGPILATPAFCTVALVSLVHLAMRGDAPSPSPPTFNPAENIPLVVSGVLVAPLIEELLHRGLVFSLLSRVLGAIPACVAGTGLFVVSHASMELWDTGFLRLLMLVSISVGLHAIRARFGSILLCIGAHAFFNSLVLLAWPSPTT